ncbi:MAG: maleylpyruvate isomerase N-terminal domain-containing protein [Actinomycetota bacterium]|nr:maleylpyruvate isomerase N-terminal domain-containing protein [Actinomycetota bacterium]
MSGARPPAEPPEDYADLVVLERDRLSELLAGLHAPDWERPSPCPGWSVLDLCCHLLGDDLGLLARHRDGYYGTPGPGGTPESEFVAWLDELQAEWVRAARRLSPRLVTELLRWAGPQITGTFRREDPRARTGLVSWAGPGPVPAWLDQARELSEYWIHRQQILQSLGRPSDLRADLARPVLDGLRWAYPYRLARVPARPGDTVTIAISGPVHQTWQLVAGTAGWAYRDQPGPRAVARLTMSTEQAWRLLTSNLPAAGQADLALSGDETITGILLRTRAIIGTPRWGMTPVPAKRENR